MTLNLISRRRFRGLFRLSVVTLTVGTLIFGSGLVTANAVTSEPVGDGSGVTIGEKRIYSPPASEGAAQPRAAWVCTALQKVDLPHISFTSAVRAVQAHGAWNRGDCKSDAAVVTTQVDKQLGPLGFFFAVGVQGKGTLRSTNGIPSGANNRVTTRYVCNGTGQGRFRAWTDVDVIGIADAPNKTYSPETNIACG